MNLLDTGFTSYWQIAFAALIIAGAQLIYMFVGFGTGLIGLGLLVLVAPTLQDAVVIILLVSLPIELFVYGKARRKIQLRSDLPIAVGIPAAVPLGAAYLRWSRSSTLAVACAGSRLHLHINESTFRRAVGIVVSLPGILTLTIELKQSVMTRVKIFLVLSTTLTLLFCTDNKAHSRLGTIHAAADSTPVGSGRTGTDPTNAVLLAAPTSQEAEAFGRMMRRSPSASFAAAFGCRSSRRSSGPDARKDDGMRSRRRDMCAAQTASTSPHPMTETHP